MLTANQEFNIIKEYEDKFLRENPGVIKDEFENRFEAWLENNYPNLLDNAIYNLEQKERQEKHETPLSELGFIGLSKFKCLECGEPVSPATVKFFDYDVLKLKCYKCQDK